MISSSFKNYSRPKIETIKNHEAQNFVILILKKWLKGNQDTITISQNSPENTCFGDFFIKVAGLRRVRITLI